MIVTLSRHVFGAVQGYRTLAVSADVPEDERRELESFSFGQTNDPGYLASLEREPSYWCRLLGSGRRAITRVLPGGTDDQGRATLRLVSAVLSADAWMEALGGDATPLLATAKLWTWDGAADLPSLRVDVQRAALPRPAAEERARVLSLLAAVERESEDPHATIVATDEILSRKELSLLISLLPYGFKPGFSFAVRSLSEGLPVHLNTLASCASRGKSRRKIVHWSPGAEYARLEYTAALEYFWPAGGDPPWEFVANCPSFGKIPIGSARTRAATRQDPPARGSGEPASTEASRMKPKRFPVYTLLILGLLAIVTATGLYVRRTVIAKRELQTLLSDARAFLEGHPLPDSPTASAGQRTELMAVADALAERVSERQQKAPDGQLEALQTEIQAWMGAAKERSGEFETLEKLVTGFNTFSGTLGLDSPQDLNQYPNQGKIDAVASWKDRLHKHRELADELGGNYPEQIRSALQRIELWEQGLRHILDGWETQLAELEAFFSADPPDHLSNAGLAAWKDQRDRLFFLADRIGGQESINSEAGMVALQERVTKCQKRPQVWEEKIAGLQHKFEADLKQALELIDDARLGFSPVGVSELVEPWRQANYARQALDKALTVWPDNEQAVRTHQTVADWMAQAAQKAFTHFESEVGLAQQVWAKAKDDVKAQNANDNSRAQTPNPGIALEIIESALSYWGTNRELIEYHNSERALELHTKALGLKSELKNAEDEWNRKRQPPGDPDQED